MIYKGFVYEIYFKPWKKKAKDRVEVIRYKQGLKCTWERISYDEYLAVKKLYDKAKRQRNRN